MRIFPVLVSVLLVANAQAAPKKPKKTEIGTCPKNKKEWAAQGPKILVAKALRQSLPIDISSLSASLGKKNGASGTATPFGEKNKPELMMVQARDPGNSLFLSGVLKCDPQKHRPALVSLAYVKDGKSGLVKVTEE